MLFLNFNFFFFVCLFIQSLLIIIISLGSQVGRQVDRQSRSMGCSRVPPLPLVLPATCNPTLVLLLSYQLVLTRIPRCDTSEASYWTGPITYLSLSSSGLPSCLPRFVTFVHLLSPHTAYHNLSKSFFFLLSFFFSFKIFKKLESNYKL